jgi:diaminohydroxyphosphoribosylaminopyrimidine deaminase / 5-amino-6-(5-phosphoribosylamino)uracil reductase
MEEKDDIKFMRRCLELASKAEGSTYPNPMVGAVVVHNSLIVGEGYHLKSGFPHAEVNAINSVKDKDLLKSSTLFVNLEPCSHFGKTPPCADFILTNSIPRVVIGTTDTSGNVSGNGILRLKNAECEVKVGVLEDECRRLNRRFFSFHEKKRPYITLKWAQSSDGYLDVIRNDGQSAEPNWISGKPERILVHKWRATEQAILVGAGTVRYDNPGLNVREWKGNDPLKLILSYSGHLDEHAAIYGSDGQVVVFTNNPEVVTGKVVKVKLNGNLPPAFQISDYLFNSGIQSLLIEGGAMVLNHFISTGLWDEARIFTGKSLFREGVKAPLVKGLLFSRSVFSDSFLESYLNEAVRK